MNKAESTCWWTVPQAAAWIRTRDRTAVEALDERQVKSLAVAALAIPGLLTASACLAEALRRGRFTARGQPVSPELGAADEMAYRALGETGDIPESFWRRGGEFTDIDSEFVLAAAAHTAARYKDVAVDADDIVGHWQAPASLFAGGKLSLKEALARLWPAPEDQPIWLLTHPNVRATGLDAAGEPVVIDFGHPLRILPDCNAVETENGRLAWSAVTLGLAASRAPSTANGMDTIRLVVNAIRADGKQLKRPDFNAMVRTLIWPQPDSRTLDGLWRDLTPEDWRKPGQGNPPVGRMVRDWKAYLPRAGA